MAYAVGHISGGHFNPAVTLGLWAGGRFEAKDIFPYWIAQTIGAIAAAGALYVIASGKAGFDLAGGFASNGYGAHSPDQYSMTAALVAEILLTMFFLLIILGSTDKRAPAGFAPIAIGLGLTLIHLISIPVTNTSVNPARSTGPALFVGGWAVSQLWLFGSHRWSVRSSVVPFTVFSVMILRMSPLKGAHFGPSSNGFEAL